MALLLLLLAFALPPASALKHARHASHIAVGPLLSEPSPILRDLPPRSEVPQYELVILRYAEELSGWVNEVPLLWEVTVLNKGDDLNVNASR